MIQAVIFDMNGVIVDDEPLHEAAFKDVCRETLGVDISHAVFGECCLGRTDFEGFHAVVKKYGIPPAIVPTLMKEKAEKYHVLSAKGIRPVRGAIACIERLQADFRLAVATSALRSEMEQVLAALEVRSLFVVCVTAEDVDRGKPNPEPYLLAAERLRLTPADCLAIEDSQSGVAAAKAAGMVCVAITTSYPRELLGAADVVIDDFDELTVDQIRNVSLR